ncbi:MAG: hypothetical protein U0929_14105 [Planctomycetaceae bacterium]
MELNDPVAIYTAGSNLDARQLVLALQAVGIESQVIEDIWVGGLNPQIHKTRLWVSKDNVDKAGAVIQEFELRNSLRFQAQGTPVELHAEWIDATCDKCGTVTRFAPIHKGTIANCPHCFAFMDVGDDVDFDDWNVIEQESNEGSDDDSGETHEEAPE